MIILNIRADNVDTIRGLGYDQIRVYRDVAQDGSFTTLLGTVALVAGVTEYKYTDTTGTGAEYYKLSYFKSSDSTETAKSAVFKGMPSSGPLDLITVSYVKANTDITEIQALSDSKIASLIIRAESMIQTVANRYGGLDATCANYATNMPAAALMVLEEIYLRSTPAARSRSAYNFQSEKIGSYSYTVAKSDKNDKVTIDTIIPPEAMAMIMGCVTDQSTISSVKSTVVFPELDAQHSHITPAPTDGIKQVPWHDYTDHDFTTDTSRTPDPSI